jgi:hypothetical protein
MLAGDLYLADDPQLAHDNLLTTRRLWPSPIRADEPAPARGMHGFGSQAPCLSGP